MECQQFFRRPVKLFPKNQMSIYARRPNHPPSFLHQESLGLTLAVARRHQETRLYFWDSHGEGLSKGDSCTNLLLLLVDRGGLS